MWGDVGRSSTASGRHLDLQLPLGRADLRLHHLDRVLQQLDSDRLPLMNC